MLISWFYIKKPLIWYITRCVFILPMLFPIYPLFCSRFPARFWAFLAPEISSSTHNLWVISNILLALGIGTSIPFSSAYMELCYSMELHGVGVGNGVEPYGIERERSLTEFQLTISSKFSKFIKLIINLFYVLDCLFLLKKLIFNWFIF